MRYKIVLFRLYQTPGKIKTKTYERCKMKGAVVMLKEITRKDFESKYPDIYISDPGQVAVYLENGTVLLYSEWNGECFIDEDGYHYEPVTRHIYDDDFVTIGYERFL